MKQAVIELREHCCRSLQQFSKAFLDKFLKISQKKNSDLNKAFFDSLVIEVKFT